MQLFGSLAPESELDPAFKHTRDYRGSLPARRLMERVFREYPGPKREFIRDFQTRGFSARTWELALFAWLRERDYDIDVPHGGAPDFVVSEGGEAAGIEASTANPSQDASPTRPPLIEHAAPPHAPADVQLSQHEFIFQMAKTLRNKVTRTDASDRHYWELDSVRGQPFVLAVQAFHGPTALYHSSGSLAAYLYGFEHTTSRTSSGCLVVTPAPVASHTNRGRTIPSAFFRQAEGRQVSAVLFSNAGTVGQFQRIAVELGLGEPGVRVFRSGTYYIADPDVDTPGEFHYEVKEGERRETFAQGLTLFHNPWAHLPLRRGFLRDVTDLWLRDDNLVQAAHPGFTPFASVTYSFAIRPDDETDVPS